MQHPIHKPDRKVMYKLNENVANSIFFMLMASFRNVTVINLDPANDALPYDFAINIEDLMKLSDVMNEHSLGPNGGLVYCLDYLEKNIVWLLSNLEPLLKGCTRWNYFFLHSNVKNVIMKLTKKFNLRLTALNLVDAHLCSHPGKYVSALLLSISTVLHLELPRINVLSKIDLIESYGKASTHHTYLSMYAVFNLDFYTDAQYLSYLQHHLDQDPRAAKRWSLFIESIPEFFKPIFVLYSCMLDDIPLTDKESVGNLVKLIDKTNGYFLAGIEDSAVEFSKIAVRPVGRDFYRYPYCC
ncbi:hypothetical protein POTOM_010139 [Populus tomentosa]|uniref:GPN-loop GTPase 2 n=1 Tax=Populus tomentosa TaxID=118781 RepID=A0A8X8DAI6_POPTO|nr:hypothetical protein POTOM_010139 [Populus tomentosa]